MAVYKDLLLREGGGILPFAQMAEELEDKAAILIGLGGTGIDCLMEIRKAVRVQIRPENPNADRKKWRNIHFLAVDSDPESGIQEFEQEEQLNIFNPNLPVAFSQMAQLKRREEMEWLDERLGGQHFLRGCMGSAAIRQIGRFLFMDRSDVFAAKIKDMLIRAGCGIPKDAPVCVYLFAGLCGGTGAGVFLDVCYLIRSIIKEMNFSQARLSGYFFLPDVALSMVPAGADSVKAHFSANGYAAMRELDYCMRLPENGGSFTQTYKGGVKAEWNVPPVDLCWLVRAADQMDQNPVSGYRCAVSRVTKSVLRSLLQSQKELQMESDQISEMMAGADLEKEQGCQLHYLALGGAEMYMPRRELYTWLAAKIFTDFAAMMERRPAEPEIRQMADWIGISRMDDLLAALSQGGSILTLVPVPDTAEFMKRICAEGDHELLDYYFGQKEEKLHVLEKTARDLTDEENPDSLISRVCRVWDICIRDWDRGPAYAYQAVWGSEQWSLIRLSDWMLQHVSARLWKMQQELSGALGCCQSRFEEVRELWHRGVVLGKRSLFREYVSSLEELVRQQIQIAQLEWLLRILKTLRGQMEKKKREYGLPLNRVIENLISTFRENERILVNPAERMDGRNLCTWPLISFQDIRGREDSMLGNVPISGLWEQFITYLSAAGTGGTPVWIAEDETQISVEVRRFFTEHVFAHLEKRDMAELLSDIRHLPDLTAVETELRDRCMPFLAEHSKICFPVLPEIYGMSDHECVQLLVPEWDKSAILAADGFRSAHPEVQVQRCAQKDRISVLRYAAGISLGAYAEEKRYERAYSKSDEPGRHLYAGAGETGGLHRSCTGSESR